MKITNYKKLKNNQYEITFDDNIKEKIYDDVILNKELLLKKELSKKDLDAILDDNKKMAAYFTGLKSISVRMKSKKELEKILCGKLFSKIEIDYAIDRLSREGYINNFKYIEAFVNDSINLSLDGPKKILNKLTELGMPFKDSVDYIDGIDSSIWENRIDKIIHKKLATKKDSNIIFVKKVTQYLINLGYESSMIFNIFSNIELESDYELFLKDAEKIWNKIKDEDLFIKKQKFIGKLYSKGYKQEYIYKFIDNKKPLD